MTPVRLEPAAPQSRVKHSTTEPLRSLFQCIDVYQFQMGILETKDEARNIQHLSMDLANVDALENNVWSLLLHKFDEIIAYTCKNKLVILYNFTRQCIYKYCLL